MLTIKELNKQMIESEIKMALSTGKYRNIDDLKATNPTLTNFCYNHKLNYIMRSFSTQFNNDDYLNLLDNIKKELNNNNSINNKITQTTIETNGQKSVFVDFNQQNNNETLIGYDNVSEIGNTKETFEHEKQYEKRQAMFVNFVNIDRQKLTQEQMKIYLAIANEPDFRNYEIFFDELGNMTNTVRKNNEMFTLETINGQLQFVKQENTKEISDNNLSKDKVKVLQLKQNNKISAAFVNTLILSFIVGSFFGIIFLAIYSKVMH